MGYISTEQVKAIRNEIKKVLTAKDGFKLSITREHYTTIRIALMQVPAEMAVDLSKRDINHYYMERMECKNTRTIFQIIDKICDKIMGGNYDRNAGDMGADYCDYNFYKSFKIGEWDKPCIIK